MKIKQTLIEGERGLSKYRNLIGIGVIFFLIFVGVVMIMASKKQAEIAEDCGFNDGKIHCVCTGKAWNIYQDALELKKEGGQNTLILTKPLNSSDT